MLTVAPVRHWHTLNASKEGRLRLHILSYNVLADVYCKPGFFRHSRRSNLKFCFRSALVTNELTAASADLIFLQEIDHLEDVYGPNLTLLGYDFLSVYRKNRDCVLIGYKKARFDLIKSEEVKHN